MIKGMTEFMTFICTLVARVIPLPEHVVCLDNKDRGRHTELFISFANFYDISKWE